MPLNSSFMDNPHADRVRRIASLRLSSVRRKTGRFLVEGPQAVREIVRWMPSRVSDVYVDTQADPNDDVVEMALASPTPIYVHRVSARVLAAISPDAQSIAATASGEGLIQGLSGVPLGGETRTEAEEKGGESGQSDTDEPPATNLIAACWQARDPGNEGTLIRTADAAGCRAVILVDDCVHPLNPKVIRSSAGSLFHIPVIQTDTDGFFDWVSGRGLATWAADIHGTPEAAPYDLATLLDGGEGEEESSTRRGDSLLSEDPAHPPVLLFGNEARGLPQEIVRRAGRSVMIPIYGKAESLNLAMSGAVLMYSAAMAQHEARG